MRDIPVRVAWLLGIVALTILLLALQLYRITVTQTATWRAQGEDNMLRELPGSAPRGSIYDAKGRALATSEPAFAAVLISQDPATVEQFMPKLALMIAEGDAARAEEISARVIRRVWDNKRDLQQFEPVTVARKLSPPVVAALIERKAEFPGLTLVTEATRNYPNGSLLGSILGYVGLISDHELSDERFKGYNLDEIVGKAGLEVFYETDLHGTPGHNNVVIDMYGRRVGDFVETPSVPGNNLTLSIDLDLQKVAEEALVKQMEWIRAKKDPAANPYRGAVVVQDVRTGAVLAMASVPTYDPNMWVRGFSEREWEALQSQPGFSEFNWAIKGLSPGSTFKMATGFAALESGTVGAYQRFDCPAVYWRYGNPKNWKPYDDGPTDVARALATSCNPYFWESAYLMKIQTMNQFFGKLGFGKRTGVDLPDESPGNNPSEESYGERWQPGEVLNVAIGQGDLQATPLQLANYTAAIATSGQRYQPYLVAEVRSHTGETLRKRDPVLIETIEAKAETWQRLQQGMWLAANHAEGTATLPMKGFPVKVGGKTGSAETGQKWSDATSVLYAPFDKPEIAISVVIQGGSTGSWTVPVARRILAQYFGMKDVIPKDVPTYQD